MESLAQYLTKQSATICSDNGCDDIDHKCDCYAYFDESGNLADICYPDYATRSYPAYIPLPWSGSDEELQAQIKDQLEEIA